MGRAETIMLFRIPLWYEEMSSDPRWLAIAVLMIAILVLYLFLRHRGAKGEDARVDSGRQDSGGDNAIAEGGPALDPSMRQAIQQTHTIVQDLKKQLQGYTPDLKAKNQRLEDEKHTLSEEIKCLRQELEEKNATVSKWLAEVTHLQKKLETTTASFDNLREVFIFLQDDPAPLIEFAQRLGVLEEACNRIKVTLSEFVAKLPSGSVSRVVNVAPFANLQWLRDRRRELADLVSQGFSAASSLVGPYAGKNVSANRFAEDMTTKLFEEFVRPEFGAFLSQLQKFYGLPKWSLIAASSLTGYGDAVEVLKGQEAKAISVLKSLGIDPLQFNFFEPYSTALNSYIHLQRAKVNDFYAEWQAGLPPPSSVLEVQRWAYLDSGGRLRHDEKADVVVSE